MKYQLCFIAAILLIVVNTGKISISGEQSTDIKINGKDVKVSNGDILANADHQDFTIDGLGDYSLSSTWSFFGLHSGVEYTLRHWHTEVNCGCWRQKCGVNCATGEECVTAYDGEEPLMCLPWTKRRGFCASLLPYAETQNYTAYHLNYITTIARTDYGGPAYKDVKVGYTIRSQLESQKYAYNAMIVGSTPRRQVDISNYRYAESEGRVITADEFAAIDNKPNMTVKFQSCPEDGKPEYTSIISKSSLNTVDRNNFRSYVILRKAAITRLQTLVYQDILTPTGVQEWIDQPEFEILDPCNQLFLTLKKDATGNFIIKDLPSNQRLINGDIICIAINDNPATQYDLVLYEMKVGSPTWTQSDRFVGLLSRDYLETLQVRVSTAFTPELTLSPATVTVEFTTELNPPIIRLAASAAVRCQVYVSSTCVFDMEASQALYATRQLQNCGVWYETGGYNCEGVLGIFFPPAKYVRAPIYGWTENTAMQHLAMRATRGSNPPDNKTAGGWGLSWLMDWNRSNWFDKIISIIIVLTVSSLLVYGGFRLYKWWKQRKGRKSSVSKMVKHTELPQSEKRQHEEKDEEEEVFYRFK